MRGQQPSPARKMSNSVKMTLPSDSVLAFPAVPGVILCLVSCADCDPTLGEDPEETARWLPDDQLVHAILAGGHRDIRTLGQEDRSWVIAGLKAFGRAKVQVGEDDESRKGRGMTSEDIAERLCCSLRLVRTIQARPLTRIAEYALHETKNFTDELRLGQSERAMLARQLEQTREELKRTREQLNRLIDAQIVGEDLCKRCGTPFDKVNTYFEAGKRRCRECNRRKQQKWRDRQKYLIEAGQMIGLGEIGMIPRNSLLTPDSAAGQGFYSSEAAILAHHPGGDSSVDRSVGDAPRHAPELP